MNTKQILAAVSVAAALTVIAPAYAGNLGGGFGGALSGGAGGMNRLGGFSGHGAFQGQGAAGGSLDKPNLRPASNAAKQGAAGGKEAGAKAAGAKAAGETTAAASKPVAANSAAQASPSKPATAPTSATVSKPSPAASLGGAGEANTGVGSHSVAANGMGTIDAQHSSNATAVDVAGAGGASATRTPQ
ncbi:MAG TPA: hypothetical protein VGI65_13540 [Steroidobacteraceae bacterium]|jgi:hypothetical protein